MSRNFLGCDREQELLLPPSLREWLPADHRAWFVLDPVEAMDLRAFFAGYRDDGWGRAAHDPAMMVAPLIYAYAIGERSSRGIERRCHEDVAVRVVTANQAPDHTTIARFRQRHDRPLGELFGNVLELCAEAGLVRVALIAVDGTKVHANASQHANRRYERLAREILEEAGRVDADEDERFGDRRGDELPPELSTSQGRRGWLREAKRRLDDRRAEEARPIPAARPARVKEAKRRLEEELWTECQANAADESYSLAPEGGYPRPSTSPPVTSWPRAGQAASTARAYAAGESCGATYPSGTPNHANATAAWSGCAVRHDTARSIRQPDSHTRRGERFAGQDADSGDATWA